MKTRIITIILLITLAFVFSSCAFINGVRTEIENRKNDDFRIDLPNENVKTNETVEAGTSAIEVSDQTGDFSVTTDDGAITSDGQIYTLTAAGEYHLKGKLEGQIVVEAGEDGEVTLDLDGATLSYGLNSPILVRSASSVRVKAAKGTENTVYDKRKMKISDDEAQGEGAISAKCDLKISGEGGLYVEGNYNNGIHTTKDLTVKDVTLKVRAVNNALKGKDSVTLESGSIDVISTAGDGIKTENTNVSSKGNQRGTVTVNDGTVNVYAAGDGIQAAYDFIMNGGKLTVYTDQNSSYTEKSAQTASNKGIKAQNELVINAGALELYSYDDGLHADHGTKFDNGSSGEGVISINGGAVSVKVNSNSSRFVKGADAIHADNTLNVNGGEVKIISAYEGLEANFVNITGGDVTIFANDDGINAAKKIGKTPAVTISGGTVNITMAGGDTDGIDSNGTFTMTDGLLIVRGAPNSNSNMTTGLDCDGAAKLTGGTLIQLGARETVPTLGNGCYTLNFGSASGGFGGPGGRPGGGRPGGGGQTGASYHITGGVWTLSELDISFKVENGYTYYGCVVYSSELKKGTTYTISNGENSYSADAG